MIKAIEEMRRGLKPHVPRFYLEAIVSTSNVPSQKVAARVLSSEPTTGTDHHSGEPILQYLKLITT